MSDTSNAHMTKKEIRSGNSKRLTTNISINHDNKINKDKLYEANNHIRNSRKSEENAYLIHSFQGHHGADGIGIQADLAHADSKDLSSFSSDPNIEYNTKINNFRYKSAYQRAEVHDSDKSVKDIDSSNIEEVFLPFFDMNHQIIQTNLLNRSNVSTMLRSDVDSSAASPFDHNLTHNNTNKDLQTNYKRILYHDKKSDGFRASNYTTKDNFYSSNYHKNKLMKGGKDNSVPVKTRSFIFTGETYDEINITRKKLLRNRETKHYQNNGTNNKNSEKPIFLVSTNKKGWIDQNLRGKDYQIANQKQMPVHNQKKIYNELKKHLEVKEQKHLMFPLQDSVEAKKILTKSHEQKRWFTSKPRSTRKLSKEIQKDAKIYANFEIEKNKFVLSPNSSYGQLNPKKSSNFKRSVRSGGQSSKNKIKGAKQRKAKDNLKDTIRLTTPKATKMLKITKLKRSKTSSSQIPINYDNNINSYKISPKYKANVDKEIPGEVYDDNIYMSQRVIDSNGQYIKANGIDNKKIASTVNKRNDNSKIEDTEIDNYEHKEDQDNSKHDRSRSNKRVLISKKKAHGTPKLYSYVNLETKDNLDDPLSNLMEVDQKDKKGRIKKLKGRNDKRTQSVRKILPLSSRLNNAHFYKLKTCNL